MKITIDEGVIAAKVAMIGTFNKELNRKAENLRACGEGEDVVAAALEDARRRFDEWLPAQLADLRLAMINSCTN